MPTMTNTADARKLVETPVPARIGSGVTARPTTHHGRGYAHVSLGGRHWPIRLGSRLWAVVLAGHPDAWTADAGASGNTATAVDSRILLARTLCRSALAIPPRRTVVVADRYHATYLEARLGRFLGPTILRRPERGGTACAILLPAHWVCWRDPDAAIAVFPGGHLVDEDWTFMRHVSAAADFIEAHQEQLLLLGAEPYVPSPPYGWIEPGPTLGLLETGPVRRVENFLERPSPSRVTAFLANGGLWNTAVLIAKVFTLTEAGRSLLPGLHTRAARAARFAGGPGELDALFDAYTAIRRADFSCGILERCPRRLAVLKLADTGWRVTERRAPR
jgi:mannose-1-phosphate guanylyltransferase